MGMGFRAAVLCVVVCAMCGCDRSPARTSSKGNDDSKLVAWLENFKGLGKPADPKSKEPARPGVASCEYTLDKSVSNVGMLPSAADTHFVLTGFADLTDLGLETLTAGFDWTPAERAAVPRALLPLLPEGDLLVSPQFNESFAQNKAFTHGFAVRPATEGSKRIYFIATDAYHPLEIPQASIVTEKDAVKIARTVVDADKSGVTVPVEADVDVKYADGKYTVTFLAPPLETPIPGAGYDAIVIIDEKTGATEILGPP